MWWNNGNTKLGETLLRSFYYFHNTNADALSIKKIIQIYFISKNRLYDCGRFAMQHCQVHHVTYNPVIYNCGSSFFELLFMKSFFHHLKKIINSFHIYPIDKFRYFFLKSEKREHVNFYKVY